MAVLSTLHVFFGLVVVAFVYLVPLRNRQCNFSDGQGKLFEPTPAFEEPNSHILQRDKARNFGYFNEENNKKRGKKAARKANLAAKPTAIAIVGTMSPIKPCANASSADVHYPAALETSTHDSPACGKPTHEKGSGNGSVKQPGIAYDTVTLIDRTKYEEPFEAEFSVVKRRSRRRKETMVQGKREDEIEAEDPAELNKALPSEIQGRKPPILSKSKKEGKDKILSVEARLSKAIANQTGMHGVVYFYRLSELQAIKCYIKGRVK
ncbi:MAG: hypothetical protein Q9227_002039 [Pyrenula ochraceoflavens]